MKIIANILHYQNTCNIKKVYIDTPCGRLSVSAVKTDVGVEVQTEVQYGVKAVLAVIDEVLPCGISQQLLNDWSK